MKRTGLIIALAAFLVMNAFSQNLTNKEKLYGLSQYWSEAKYNFVYFDRVPTLKWDSLYQSYIPKVLNTKTNFEYFREMQAFAASLSDGHSLVLLPDYVKNQLDAPGILLKEFDNKFLVVNVDKSLSKKIPLGSEIMIINETPIEKYLIDSILPYISASTLHVSKYKSAQNLLKGIKNTKLTVTIKQKNNKISTVDLIRNSKAADWKIPINNPSGFTFKIIENDIAYIQLNSFFNPEIIDDFKNIIPEIGKCKALIFDVRNNEGGDADLGLEILQHFTISDFYRLPYKTKKHIAAYKAWGTYQLYRFGETKFMDYATDNAWLEENAEQISNKTEEIIDIPIIVITGNKTYSAGEDFVVFAKQLGDKVKIVGEPTSGSTGQVLMFMLPGGALAGVCAKRDYFADGTKFAGFGIKPDFIVQPSLKNILDNKDVVLEKALKILE